MIFNQLRNKQHGFTLIELLAVIVILAVIALIVTPIILGIIDDAKTSANKETVNGLVNVGRVYFATESTLGSFTEKQVFDFSNEQTYEKITFEGRRPDSGFMAVYTDGEVGIAVTLDNNCYIKEPSSSEVQIFPLEDSNCALPISLSDITTTTVSSGDGLYTDNTGISDYLYRGTNPNNYVAFAGSCFRIVNIDADNGFKMIYDGNVAAKTTNPCANIYDQSISVSWWGDIGYVSSWNGTSGTAGIDFINNWMDTTHNSSRKYFENIVNDTTIHNYDTIQIGNPSRGLIKITSTEKSKIIKSKFYYGAIEETTLDNPITDIINEEKTNSGSVAHLTKTGDYIVYNGYIGLLNVSDYLRASTNSSCSTYRTCAYGDGSCINPCESQNYLKKDYFWWSISALGNNNSQVVNFDFKGYLYSSDFGETISLRPVLYLNKNIKLYGKGTFTDPYRLYNKLGS